MKMSKSTSQENAGTIRPPEKREAENMLEVKGLFAGYYKDLNILQDLNVIAEKGRISTVLGANGVGKSTLLKAVFGFLKPNAGEILFNGTSILKTPTYRRIQKGLAYIPQQPGIFRDMTVEENLEIGAWTFRRNKKLVKTKIDENYARFPILAERRNQMTGQLSGGQQRMVEIGRTLMSEPKMLLVDEPTAGLAKLLTQEVYRMLTELRDKEGLTILLVDQDIRKALKISDYVYVLELGRNKYEGPASEFTDVKKAFWVGND
jgi:branched-chain amino acid transport system ATP-binding protein